VVSRRALRIFDGIQLTAVLAVLAVPIAWTFLLAFKTRTEVAALPPKLFFTPTLENFIELFSRNDFLR
jgi:multiple sugar transport system permease protein